MLLIQLILLIRQALIMVRKGTFRNRPAPSYCPPVASCCNPFLDPKRVQEFLITQDGMALSKSSNISVAPLIFPFHEASTSSSRQHGRQNICEMSTFFKNTKYRGLRLLDYDELPSGTGTTRRVKYGPHL